MFLDTIGELEREFYSHAAKKVKQKYKNRVVMLKKLRSGQYLKTKGTGYEHGKKVRKHEDEATGVKKRKRRCGWCLKEGIVTTKHTNGKKCPFYEQYGKKSKRRRKSCSYGHEGLDGRITRLVKGVPILAQTSGSSSVS